VEYKESPLRDQNLKLYPVLRQTQNNIVPNKSGRHSITVKRFKL